MSERSANHENGSRQRRDVQDDPTLARAEDLVDQAGARVGHFLNTAGREARKALARAREEAEDIWAEAQAKSREP